MSMDKHLCSSLFSLFFNIGFCAYHVTFGIMTRSWWMITVGAYYTILAAIRLITLRTEKRIDILRRLVGVTLVLLTIPLIGTVVLSVAWEMGNELNRIIMIAIATYSFTKITVAVINIKKARKRKHEKLILLRNISLADACVSIFSLQRSMLASFEGMTAHEIQLMNALTGSAVCLIVFLLGLYLLRTNR